VSLDSLSDGGVAEGKEKNKVEGDDGLQKAVARVEANSSRGSLHGNLSDDMAMCQSPFYRKPS
jgi:hypothetical protein